MGDIFLLSTNDSLLSSWKTMKYPTQAFKTVDSVLKAVEGLEKAIVVVDVKGVSHTIIAQLCGHKNISVFALCGVPNYEDGVKILGLGAKGYGNSYMQIQHLNAALEIINEGKVWVYPEFMQTMIQRTCVPSSKDNETPRTFDILTHKENEVVHLVAQGKSNKEVAIAMEITERTVKAHLSTIYKKLNISDRLSLALWVGKHEQ